MEFKWITKGKRFDEVSITRNKYNKSESGYSYGIRFRDSSFLKITKTNHMVLAVVDNRIYFKESDEKEGFKLTNPSDNGRNSGFSVCTVDLSDFVGDYELLLDNEHKLFYVDKSKAKRI